MAYHVRVKICGVTTAADTQQAAQAGRCHRTEFLRGFAASLSGARQEPVTSCRP